jgi:hypothetical protein
MKIYFEDGELMDQTVITDPYTGIVVDAARGVSACIMTLDACAKCRPSSIIYTNSIFAFHNMYAWNEELGVPEIYIRAGEDGAWVRIDKLTNRTLKQVHNLAKMYVAGEFEKLGRCYNDSEGI